jgi:hypothetical protein
MATLFHALVDRLKALFVSHTALDFEAQFLASQAERQAELLRRAAEYEREGLDGVANDLRAQAESLSIQKPLAGVLPAIGHLQGQSKGLLLTAAPTPRSCSTQKKGGRA